MNMPSDQELCRVSIVGPRSRVDLTVPTQMPFADLLPIVIGYTGGDLLEESVENEGWVLQRVDEPPLPLNATPAEVGLRHGETLHLRPRTRPLPEISVLELVDPLVAGENEAAGQWGPRWSDLSAQAALVAALVGLAVLFLRSGAGWITLTVMAATVSTVSLVGCWALSRHRVETRNAAVLALTAPPFAFLAAMLCALRDAPIGFLGPAQLAYGLLAAALAGAIAACVAPGARPLCLGCAAALALGAAAGGVGTVWSGLPAAALAAGTLSVVLPLSALAPALSLRLAAWRLLSGRLDNPIGLAEPLSRSGDPVAGSSQGRLLQRAADVNLVMSICAVALTVLATGAGLVLAVSGGRWGRAACVLSAGALLLCARRFDGGAQRMALLTSGSVSLAFAAAASATDASPLLAMALPALVLFAVAVIALRTSVGPHGGHRPGEWNPTISPVRANILAAAEALTWLALAATVPVLAGVSLQA
ncbi:type VII secretion integral membrane protein EccD [Streptomyces sp. NPDC005355]|uniref:type VII secretion integral membrane protein EccD n=1 Tax=Streptomyces sp. NPDC005355 TaxID=3157038 RepID=UPI0033AB8B60